MGPSARAGVVATMSTTQSDPVLRDLARLLSDHMTVTASSAKAGGIPPDVVLRLMVVPEYRKLGASFEQLTSMQYDAFLQTLSQKIVSFDGLRRMAFLNAARQLRVM